MEDTKPKTSLELEIESLEATLESRQKALANLESHHESKTRLASNIKSQKKAIILIQRRLGELKGPVQK